MKTESSITEGPCDKRLIAAQQISVSKRESGAGEQKSLRAVSGAGTPQTVRYVSLSSETALSSGLT